MEYTIRPAELDDCDAIGNVHVLAWQGAYRGVMPDEYLDGLRAEDRALMWRGYFAVPRPDHQLTVVVHAGEVVGFAASGPEAGDSARSDVGELYAINLAPSSWGKGFGRALLRDVYRHTRQCRLPVGGALGGAPEPESTVPVRVRGMDRRRFGQRTGAPRCDGQ